ncbi:hypothetical protein [Streptomyces sp. NPDC002265]|uniref:hypothetical protein n=1 Tax=Streptomyces sp. NPDC002265 TaxID=3154415 RepID=UPI00332486F1
MTKTKTISAASIRMPTADQIAEVQPCTIAWSSTMCARGLGDADVRRQESGSPMYCAPYLGEFPQGPAKHEIQQWAGETPGVPVGSQSIKELADAAVRGAVVGGRFPVPRLNSVPVERASPHGGTGRLGGAPVAYAKSRSADTPHS